MNVFVEPDVQRMSSKGQTPGYAMTAVDDLISDIFNRLHSLKDDLITIISNNTSNETEQTGLS